MGSFPRRKLAQASGNILSGSSLQKPVSSYQPIKLPYLCSRFCSIADEPFPQVSGFLDDTVSPSFLSNVTGTVLNSPACTPSENPAKNKDEGVLAPRKEATNDSGLNCSLGAHCQSSNGSTSTRLPQNEKDITSATSGKADGDCIDATVSTTSLEKPDSISVDLKNSTFDVSQDSKERPVAGINTTLDLHHFGEKNSTFDASQDSKEWPVAGINTTLDLHHFREKNSTFDVSQDSKERPVAGINTTLDLHHFREKNSTFDVSQDSKEWPVAGINTTLDLVDIVEQTASAPLQPSGEVEQSNSAPIKPAETIKHNTTTDLTPSEVLVVKDTTVEMKPSSTELADQVNDASNSVGVTKPASNSRGTEVEISTTAFVCSVDTPDDAPELKEEEHYKNTLSPGLAAAGSTPFSDMGNISRNSFFYLEDTLNMKTTFLATSTPIDFGKESRFEIMRDLKPRKWLSVIHSIESQSNDELVCASNHDGTDAVQATESSSQSLKVSATCTLSHSTSEPANENKPPSKLPIKRRLPWLISKPSYPKSSLSPRPPLSVNSSVAVKPKTLQGPRAPHRPDASSTTLLGNRKTVQKNIAPVKNIASASTVKTSMVSAVTGYNFTAVAKPSSSGMQQMKPSGLQPPTRKRLALKTPQTSRSSGETVQTQPSNKSTGLPAPALSTVESDAVHANTTLDLVDIVEQTASAPLQPSGEVEQSNSAPIKPAETIKHNTTTDLTPSEVLVVKDTTVEMKPSSTELADQVNDASNSVGVTKPASNSRGTEVEISTTAFVCSVDTPDDAPELKEEEHYKNTLSPGLAAAGSTPFSDMGNISRNSFFYLDDTLNMKTTFLATSTPIDFGKESRFEIMRDLKPRKWLSVIHSIESQSNDELVCASNHDGTDAVQATESSSQSLKVSATCTLSHSTSEPANENKPPSKLPIKRRLPWLISKPSYPKSSLSPRPPLSVNSSVAVKPKTLQGPRAPHRPDASSTTLLGNRKTVQKNIAPVKNIASASTVKTSMVSAVTGYNFTAVAKPSSSGMQQMKPSGLQPPTRKRLALKTPQTSRSSGETVQTQPSNKSTGLPAPALSTVESDAVHANTTLDLVDIVEQTASAPLQPSGEVEQSNSAPIKPAETIKHNTTTDLTPSEVLVVKDTTVEMKPSSTELADQVNDASNSVGVTKPASNSRGTEVEISTTAFVCSVDTPDDAPELKEEEHYKNALSPGLAAAGSTPFSDMGNISRNSFFYLDDTLNMKTTFLATSTPIDFGKESRFEIMRDLKPRKWLSVIHSIESQSNDELVCASNHDGTDAVQATESSSQSLKVSATCTLSHSTSEPANENKPPSKLPIKRRLPWLISKPSYPKSSLSPRPPLSVNSSVAVKPKTLQGPRAPHRPDASSTTLLGNRKTVQKNIAPVKNIASASTVKTSMVSAVTGYNFTAVAKPSSSGMQQMKPSGLQPPTRKRLALKTPQTSRSSGETVQTQPSNKSTGLPAPALSTVESDAVHAAEAHKPGC